MRRYRVVAHKTLGGEHLMEHVRSLREEGPCRFLLLVPVEHPKDHAWSDGECAAAARKKLQEGLDHFHDAGIIADGVASGEFDVPDVDEAAACFQAALISSCHPVIIEHRLRSGEDIEASLDPMLAFALRALGARNVKGEASP